MQHRYKTMPADEAKQLVLELMAPFDVTFDEDGALKRVLVSGRFADPWSCAQGDSWGDCACAVVLMLVRANGGVPDGRCAEFIDEWYPDWLDYCPGESRGARKPRLKIHPAITDPTQEINHA